MDTNFSIFDRKYFDGCFHCLLLNALKVDRLNFDGLAGKYQKRQNFPPSKFPAMRY